MSTPTVALFHEDDYAREMDATVLTADGDAVALDQTVFYPRGGNQDCDTGTLARTDAPESAPVPVVEVLKDDAGVIRHRVDALAAWPAGTPVHGAILWPRRFTMMRLHTAQHMISRWFLDEQQNETTRVDINGARCIVEFARPITLADALACQAALHAMIRAGRPVDQAALADPASNLQKLARG
jgi:misacylated tRNA(Ala) deacylase